LSIKLRLLKAEIEVRSLNFDPDAHVASSIM